MITCSIIIPVYNTPETSLRKCLGCFCDAGETFEVIIVDDGSREETVHILEEYRGRIPLCQLIRQKNAGVSAARNRGIEISQGKWVVFCDADDEIDTGKLRDLLNKLDPQTDFVYSAFAKVRTGRQIINYPEELQAAGYTKKLLCHPNMYGTVWAKVFAGERLRASGVRFQEDLSHAEDTVFLLSWLKQAEKTVYCDEPFYTYYVSADSAAKKNTDAVNAFLRTFDRVREELDMNDTKTAGYYGSYVNTTLMIILANYIFTKNKPAAESIRELRDLLRVPVIQRALREYDRAETSFAQRQVITALRYQMIPMIRLIFRIYRMRRG